ncbi:hypothetical protein [Arthrobacter sulfonylureivorans]|uniref:DRBM domain-containing protein n=1 Tax=Arthrobacter sulfonylureivorans TaxID=2486855 RepID=A0ABY3W7D7_9MICC|nr:hypothetical protein [Arthrobacter sulfonylureivorans]UNK45397.1 hypothetical protein MNQ99_15905 [Arthrobacter sulfonylureivorans]
MARVKLAQGDWTTPKAKNETTGVWRAWCRFGGFDVGRSPSSAPGRTKAIAEKNLMEALVARRE